MLWTKEVCVYPFFDPVISHSHKYVSPTISTTSLQFYTSYSYQGNIIALLVAGLPLSTTTTLIPEDRPRGPCVLDSLTFMMSAYESFREESSVPLRMVVSHMLDFNTLIASLRLAQGIGPFSYSSKTPDTTWLLHIWESNYGYNHLHFFYRYPGCVWRQYSDVPKFYTPLSIQLHYFSEMTHSLWVHTDVGHLQFQQFNSYSSVSVIEITSDHEYIP